MPRLKVTINGTDTNPWHKWGLKINPFPQLGKAEYDKAERQLMKLDSDPIKDVAQIREILKGFSEEFVELCIRQFKPGERVSFEVTFPW